VSVTRIAKIYAIGCAGMARSGVATLARRLGILPHPPLLAELLGLSERGVHAVMVFSHGEPGLALLAQQCGLALPQLSQRVRIRLVDDADHEFTRREQRQILINLLEGELYARSPVGSLPRANDGANGRESSLPRVDLVPPPPKH